MRFTVDKSLCIGCGACFRACPRGVFSPDDEGKMNTIEDPCLQCFHCTAICPTKAVHCSDVADEELYTDYSGEALYGLMQKRRSTRNFGPGMPEKEFIRKVLDRVEGAASAKNQHPTRWTVILGKERLDEMYRRTVEWAKRTNNELLLYSMVTLNRNAVTCEASCAIVGCCPTDGLVSSPELDTAIALTQAELMFVEAGWNTCWSGYLRWAIQAEPSVWELAGIPEGYRPYAVLLVGKEQGERYLRPAYRPAARINWTE